MKRTITITITDGNADVTLEEVKQMDITRAMIAITETYAEMTDSTPAEIAAQTVKWFKAKEKGKAVDDGS